MNMIRKISAYATTYSSCLVNFVLHKLRRQKVGIVILSRSQSIDIIRMTQRCIDSLLLQNRSKLHIVVVESGPRCEYQNADVLVPEEDFNYNLYVKMGLNHIMATDSSHYYVILNNDIIAFPGAIDRLIQTGLLSSSPVNPLHCDQTGVTKITFGYSIRYHLVGWAICMRTELFRRITLDDLFPTDFAFHHQDNYYAHMLNTHGVVHAAVPAAKIVHFEGASHALRPDLLSIDSAKVFQEKVDSIKVF